MLADGSDRMLKMAELLLGADEGVQDEAIEILAWMIKVKLANIRQYIESIIAETCEGIEHIASIVNSLRFLDRADTFVKTELEDLSIFH
jgi:signal transduction histidine kinase